ncbi:MAG: 2TM domain-containing protein [Anaerolineae bacterium]|nr:2TM domain-containing protein [Anaerolineae bacterium]
MEDLSKKWRGFWGHLGVYVIVIGMLGMINLLAESPDLWFLFPAVGWGAGLAFHLMGIFLASLKNMSGKWRGFLGHLGSYIIIIGMLGLINLLAESPDLWFLFPATGWGAALALHFLGILLGKEETEEERQARKGLRREHREQRRERRERGFRQDEAESSADLPSERKKEERPRQVAYPSINQEQTNPVIHAHLDKALAYQAQIENLIKSTSTVNTRARLQDLAAQVGEWIEAIEDLVKRIDSFQGNNLIRQDLEAVPQAIAKLEAQLTQESDPAIHNQLERTLTSRRNQLASLERLQTTMKRAEIQIESTLSALGTIYSQLLTGESTDHVADYSRLSAEVDEEVRLLQDRLEALEEVKLGRT